jgi:hypothetical protein
LAMPPIAPGSGAGRTIPAGIFRHWPRHAASAVNLRLLPRSARDLTAAREHVLPGAAPPEEHAVPGRFRSRRRRRACMSLCRCPVPPEYHTDKTDKLIVHVSDVNRSLFRECRDCSLG